MIGEIEPTIKNEQGEIIIEVPLGQDEPLPLIPPVIRWLRKQAGLTQQELANRMGVRRENVSRGERRTQEMDVADDVKVMRFLKAVAPWKVSVTEEGPRFGIEGSPLFQFLNLPYLVLKSTTEPDDWPVM